MICLDANYLIRGLMLGSPEAKAIIAWYRAGEKMSTSSIAWYEFLCGPVSKEQIQTMRLFLAGGIIPFREIHAQESARLFNRVNRICRLRVDTMIAATAMVEQSELATKNHADFQLFAPLGLRLTPPLQPHGH
jgi:predicted nucleic acid-binding protein